MAISPRHAVMVLALVVAACGNSATTISTPTVSSSTTSSATPTQSVTAFDADNGSTITLQSGQELDVILNNTYWTMHGSSDARVLRATGDPVVTPDRTCVPGEGCGTVETIFLAVSHGEARVTASRTTCGEAMACPPNETHFLLTVDVT